MLGDVRRPGRIDKLNILAGAWIKAKMLPLPDLADNGTRMPTNYLPGVLAIFDFDWIPEQ